MRSASHTLALTLLFAAGFAGAAVERSADGPLVWRSHKHLSWVTRGWEQVEAGNIDRAEKHFQRVAERTRDGYERSQALLGLAAVQQLRGQTVAALAVYREIVALNRLPDAAHQMVVARISDILAAPIRTAAIDPRPAAAEAAVGPRELEPIAQVAPRYPRKALRGRLEGEVTVLATVNRHGAVIDVEVVSASPTGLFEEAALAAMQRWRFSPPERIAQVEQTFDFLLEER
ncbi:MAG: energy transducer TonB [Pseudomonadota bacterium]